MFFDLRSGSPSGLRSERESSPPTASDASLTSWIVGKSTTHAAASAAAASAPTSGAPTDVVMPGRKSSMPKMPTTSARKTVVRTAFVMGGTVMMSSPVRLDFTMGA